MSVFCLIIILRQSRESQRKITQQSLIWYMFFDKGFDLNFISQGWFGSLAIGLVFFVALRQKPHSTMKILETSWSLVDYRKFIGVCLQLKLHGRRILSKVQRMDFRQNLTFKIVLEWVKDFVESFQKQVSTKFNFQDTNSMNVVSGEKIVP